MYVYTYYKYVRIYPTLQNFATKKFSQITGNGEAEIFAKKILQMSLPGERVVLEYQLQNRVWNLADVSTRCSGLLQGKDGQSIWSKRRQGFQPCFEAGIWELPLLMPEPAEKPSLHSYLRERYGSSTQKLVREHERSLHNESPRLHNTKMASNYSTNWARITVHVVHGVQLDYARLLFNSLPKVACLLCICYPITMTTSCCMQCGSRPHRDLHGHWHHDVPVGGQTECQHIWVCGENEDKENTDGAERSEWYGVKYKPAIPSTPITQPTSSIHNPLPLTLT